MYRVIRYETETGANKATILTREAYKDAKAGLNAIADNALRRNKGYLGPDFLPWEVTYQKGRTSIIVKCGTPYGGRLRTFAIVRD